MFVAYISIFIFLESNEGKANIVRCAAQSPIPGVLNPAALTMINQWMINVNAKEFPEYSDTPSFSFFNLNLTLIVCQLNRIKVMSDRIRELTLIGDLVQELKHK